MQQVEDIQLKPIIEPTEVPFSFDTIGWKMLFVFIAFLVIYFIYKYYLNYKKNQYRRDAILHISELNNNSENSITEVVKQTMFQIKLTALETFGRNKVASLEGVNWIQFLNKSGKNSNFDPYQETILNAVYKDEIIEKSKFNKEEFTKTSIKWIKNHA